MAAASPLGDSCTEITAKTVSFVTYGAYAYNGFNGSIVLCTLMEMFYLSSSHLLFKSDICQSLWPGKDNADETLYTLIRRLKPIVEDNSNLRITTDRGRAYGLEIKT